MNFEIYKKELKKILSEKRYNHSVRVFETALELAKIYGADFEKVGVAALLHDYAKEFKDEELIKLTKEIYGKKKKDIDNIAVLHGYVGADIVEKKMGIKDKEILNAIKYHTTGKKGIGLVEKIVYVADTIEPERNFKNIEYIRELAKKDIDATIIFIVNETIKYLIEKKCYIDKNSIKMRNWLLKKINLEGKDEDR